MYAQQTMTVVLGFLITVAMMGSLTNLTNQIEYAEG